MSELAIEARDLSKTFKGGVVAVNAPVGGALARRLTGCFCYFKR